MFFVVPTSPTWRILEVVIKEPLFGWLETQRWAPERSWIVESLWYFHPANNELLQSEWMFCGWATWGTKGREPYLQPSQPQLSSEWPLQILSPKRRKHRSLQHSSRAAQGDLGLQLERKGEGSLLLLPAGRRQYGSLRPGSQVCLVFRILWTWSKQRSESSRWWKCRSLRFSRKSYLGNRDMEILGFPALRTGLETLLIGDK